MTTLRHHHARLALALSLVALPVGLALASCADSEQTASSDVDASTLQPGPDAASGATDAGCEAGSATCVSSALSCAEADFCPVTSPIDRRHVLLAVSATSASDVWAVGSGGTILHHDGKAWTAVLSGTTDTLNAVWGSSPADVWIASSSSTILHGNATKWSVVPAFTKGSIRAGRMHALWGASARDVRVGGQPFSTFDDQLGISAEGNHLRTLTDGGAGWEVTSGLQGRWTLATVRAIWGSSASDVWMSLDNGDEEPWARGTLVHGTAASAGTPLTWSSVDSQSTGVLEAIWGAGGEVWAVGAAGAIRRFTPGAARWATVPAKTTATLHAIWGSGPKDVWAVGDAGTILHFDGAAWTSATVAFPLGEKPTLRGVGGSGPNDVWVVGDAFILHFTGKKAAR